jgi:hypothetical protein
MCLEMKKYCENCGKKLNSRNEKIFICSYEFTSCEECARQEKFKCPHCEGSLEIRPVRLLTSIKAIPVNNVEEVFFYDNKGNITDKLKINPVFFNSSV